MPTPPMRNSETRFRSMSTGDQFPAADAASVDEGAEVTTLHVAVGKEDKRNLEWALRSLPPVREIVLVHVHRPAKKIPTPMGVCLPESQAAEVVVKAYRLEEREKMDELLNAYMNICINAKLETEKLVIVKDDIAKGLVELIAQHGITRLVMGAAPDGRYSGSMKGPSCRIAKTVYREAHPSCKIWFVCKGNLICTRNTSQDGVPNTKLPRSATSSPQWFNRGGWFGSGRKSSNDKSYNDIANAASGSGSGSGSGSLIQEDGSTTSSTPVNRLVAEDSHFWEGSPRNGLASSSSPSSSSGGHEIVSNLDSTSASSPAHNHVGDPQTSYARGEQLEGTEVEGLYDKLQQALTEAETSKREAFEESKRRNKSEREALELARRMKDLEFKYAKEVKQRNEIENALASEKMELESLKSHRDAIDEKLQRAKQQKLEMETQITESIDVIEDLKGKLSSLMVHFDELKTERDELHQKWEDAIKEANELRCGREEASGPAFLEFSRLEIDQASESFENSLIGEGGYGKVYKGILRHTPVAIKVLHPGGLQGQSEFHQEINILSWVRHPNLVTLIGVCSEALALVYEYLPNGSLEDRLACAGNSRPLTWQVRIRIMVEICSALIFLHSSRPQSIVHGDLKPANILLDANYLSKLGDFGISRLLGQSATSSTLFLYTNPKGTFAYMDPEFISSGVLTTQSDVYSFGIIILQLLTRKPPLGIVKEVKEALDNKGKLQDVLDATAGAWPFVQARQLASLGIRCCQMNRKDRPDLVNEVWRVLEPMKNACLAPSPSVSIEEDQGYTPTYFVCPIFQEVMRDPHVAADGFTYEAEALKGWLDAGHETSPMTNLKLENDKLIPNHALRSAIQEWLQRRNKTM